MPEDGKDSSTKPLKFERIPDQDVERYHQLFARISVAVEGVQQSFTEALTRVQENQDGTDSALQSLITQLTVVEDDTQTLRHQLLTEFHLANPAESLKSFPEIQVLKDSIAKLSEQLFTSYPLEGISEATVDRLTVVMLQCHDISLEPDSLEDTTPRNHGYYLIDRELTHHSPEFNQLRKQLIEEPDKDLTHEQLRLMQTEQDTVLKLHLQVSQAQARQVVVAIVRSIYQNPEASPFLTWKFLPPDSLAGGGLASRMTLPTFVFYTENQTQDNVQHLNDQAIAIIESLQAEHISLPQTAVTPRFSAPVAFGGQRVPGLFYVQGDSDYKIYLQRHGLLKDVYDADQNYAVRRGQPPLFD